MSTTRFALVTLAAFVLAAAIAGPISAQPIREAFAVLKDPVAVNGDSVGWSVGIANGDVFSGGIGGTFSNEDSGIGLRFRLDAPTNPTRFGPDYITEAQEFGRWLSVGDGFVAATVEELTPAGFKMGIALHDAETTIVQRFIPGSTGFNPVVNHQGPIAAGSGYLAAKGSLNVGVYSSDTGELLHTLYPSTVPSGSFEFGYALAVEGSLLATGNSQQFSSDPGLRPDGTQVVRFFEMSSGIQIGSVTSPLPQVDNLNPTLFATSLALSNGLLAVGAPARTSGIAGRVYIYNAATLELVRTLFSPDPVLGDNFGQRLAADNGRLVVHGGGVLIDPDCDSCGYINTFVYDMLTGELITMFLPPDEIRDDRGNTGLFGFSVAIEDNLVAIGAPRATNIPFRPDGTGAIAVYEIIPTTVECPADTNGDGIVTPADYNAWILAYNQRAPACDQNDDGLCTPADYNGWILNYNAGC